MTLLKFILSGNLIYSCSNNVCTALLWNSCSDYFHCADFITVYRSKYTDFQKLEFQRGWLSVSLSVLSVQHAEVSKSLVQTAEYTATVLGNSDDVTSMKPVIIFVTVYHLLYCSNFPLSQWKIWLLHTGMHDHFWKYSNIKILSYRPAPYQYCVYCCLPFWPALGYSIWFSACLLFLLLSKALLLCQFSRSKFSLKFHSESNLDGCFWPLDGLIVKNQTCKEEL